MKTITLWQPWASLIVFGYKNTEYRTHDRFRHLVGGRIAIHAGQADDRAFDQARAQYAHVDWARTPTPHGVVMGTARVTGLTWLEHARLWAYHLADVERFVHYYPAKGRQGVWGWFPPKNAKTVAVLPVPRKGATS